MALGDGGRPAEVPSLILETEEEKRRHAEAVSRGEMRLAEKAQERKSHR